MNLSSLLRLLSTLSVGGATITPVAHAATPAELLSGYAAKAGSPAVPARGLPSTSRSRRFQ